MPEKQKATNLLFHFHEPCWAFCMNKSNSCRKGNTALLFFFRFIFPLVFIAVQPILGQILAQSIPATDPNAWQLVWEDEFDSPSLNTKNWNLNDWRIWVHGRTDLEIRRTTDQNFIFDTSGTGKIAMVVKKEKSEIGEHENIVTKKLEPVTYEFSAPAWLMSNQEFKYGYFESRVKMPRLRRKQNHLGIGANFWLYNESSGPVAYSEIDIFEFISRCEKQHVYTVNAHFRYKEKTENWDAYFDPNCYCQCENYLTSPDVSSWNIFGMNWQPNFIQFYVNNSLIQTLRFDPVKDPKPEQFIPLRIILDVNFWMSEFMLGKKHKLPYSFEVDYVRVYKLK